MKKVKVIAASVAVCGVALVTAGVLATGGTPTTHCTYNQSLPDKTCTPGTLNPQVTQTTIYQTICVKGWTATIRPPVSVTEPIKVQVEKDYGVPSPHPKPFSQEELDHLIPLELGGSPQGISNLWPQPAPAYHVKDQIENQLHREVCDGKLQLADAQTEIATDWTRGAAVPSTGNPDQ